MIQILKSFPQLPNFLKSKTVRFESGNNHDIMSHPVPNTPTASAHHNHPVQQFDIVPKSNTINMPYSLHSSYLQQVSGHPAGSSLGKTVLPASILKGAGNLFLQSYAQKKGFLQRSPIPKNPKKQLLQKCRCWPRPQFTQASFTKSPKLLKFIPNNKFIIIMEFVWFVMAKNVNNWKLDFSCMFLNPNNFFQFEF